MLTNLSIGNYALIQKLEMEPSSALNMITGETGAGKSIMLGAVGLLLGNRSDTKSLFDENKKCVVEGVFDIHNYGLQHFFEEEELDYDPICIIRREISPSGKSRAFVNDTPVKLDTLRQLGKTLMDIHSQHENLLLGAASYQLSLVDAFAQTSGEITVYQEAFSTYTRQKTELKTLEEEAKELKKEADYNQFQLDELTSLAPEEGEQKSLENQQEILDHAEDIKAKINHILQLLEDEQTGAMQSLTAIQHHFHYLSRFSLQFEELSERFQSAWIELKDIRDTLVHEDQGIDVDYEKLEWVRERLSKIYQLQKKHGLQTDAELIQLKEALERKVIRVDHLDDQIQKLKTQLASAEEQMMEKGKILSKKRSESFKPFSKEIETLLAQLGMENARVEITRRDISPGPSGLDEIDILFSANKGIAPQPIKQVASGGEFSRLMFAVKFIMADKMALPTLIFDEIDTGISGEIALQMVKMMQQIAANHQVICISHLPQVAAKGERHYFVYKDNSASKTVSKIKLLTEQERLLEIAKMISGSNPTASAYESAKELLGI
ncbi:DNA repair protein RecN [Negadavirga shengliensis]|uniref:DNA repair protein RecN n=1 Tax=Negadavirga shengliensis TaxID=1389218 RepID=A0ABV9SUV2_9BACT